MTGRSTLLDPGEFLVGGYFNRILKASPERYIIAGYASPQLTDSRGNIRGDREGDNVTLEALDKGYRNMMRRQSRRNLMGYHSSTQIGELLVGPVTDSKGVVWSDGVVYEPNEQYTEKGLFVIAEVFNDTLEGKRYIKQMEKGNMLAFSIGGETLSQKMVCEGGFCRNDIDEIELGEVSSCADGMNNNARAFVLKAIKPNTTNTLSTVKDGASLLRLLHSRTR